MIQIIVTGKVTRVDKAPVAQNSKPGFVATLEEKVWNGEKEIVRLWEIELDAYQGEKLIKAIVNWKFFGFICDAMRLEWEWQGEKKGMVVWQHARGNKFFNL